AAKAAEDKISGATSVMGRREILGDAIGLAKEDLAALTDELRSYVGLLAQIPVHPLVTNEQLDQLVKLEKDFRDGKISAGEFEKAVSNLEVKDPDLNGVLDRLIAKLGASAAAAQQLQSELDKLNLAGAAAGSGALGAGGAGSLKERGLAEQFLSTDAQRNRLTREQLALESEIARVRKEADDKGVTSALSEAEIRKVALDRIAAENRRDATDRARTSAKQDMREEEQRKEQWDAATMSIEERIQALQLEIDMEGKSVEATERATAAMELLNTAKRLGIELTPELRARIEELAAALGQMAQKAHDSAETAQEAQQRLDEIRDVGRDAIHGIVDALEDGKLKGREFLDILKNIASQLLEMSVNGFLDGLLGKQGSPGGGFLSALLGGFLGGGAGGSSTGGFTGFASGTANTGGGRGQVRGVVHGQEAVIPLPNGGRVPVDLRMPSMAQAPVRIDLRLHPTDQFSVEVDNRIDRRTPAIVRTSVQQSSRAAKEALPAMLADARARRM
ncbi:MAG: hypothetical protein AB7U38_15115, partial [Hyphomicrobiales bacterium]